MNISRLIISRLELCLKNGLQDLIFEREKESIKKYKKTY